MWFQNSVGKKTEEKTKTKKKKTPTTKTSIEQNRDKRFNQLCCFIIFDHALEVIVSGMEWLPNNLELPFLFIFYVSHVGTKQNSL